jgi:hypothetical protein
MSTEKSFANKYHKPMPVCKHCKNLSTKYPDIRFDHWLRESPDPKSAIVCPQLKYSECTWCGDEGHTKKYCKDFIRYIQERNGFDALSERMLEQYKHRKIEEATKSTKAFAVLSGSDIEEEPAADYNKDAAPLIRPPSPLTPPPPHIGIFGKSFPDRVSKTEFPALSSNSNKHKSPPASQVATFWGKPR